MADERVEWCKTLEKADGAWTQHHSTHACAIVNATRMCLKDHMIDTKLCVLYEDVLKVVEDYFILTQSGYYMTLAYKTEKQKLFWVIVSNSDIFWYSQKYSMSQ